MKSYESYEAREALKVLIRPVKFPMIFSLSLSTINGQFSVNTFKSHVGIVSSDSFKINSKPFLAPSVIM